MQINKRIFIYSSTLIVLCLILLVGNRLGFTWAGGTGFVQQEKAYFHTLAEDITFKRGDVVSTNEKGFYFEGQLYWDVPAPLILGEKDKTVIYLDKNTEIRLDSLAADNYAVTLIQGRIVVEGPATVQIRELDMQTTDVTGFVHYSWLDQVDILPFGTTPVVQTTDEQITLQYPYIKMDTLPPYKQQGMTFEPETSDGKEFYLQLREYFEVPL